MSLSGLPQSFPEKYIQLEGRRSLLGKKMGENSDNIP